MRLFELLAILTSLAALFSWINQRYLRLPRAIGLMAITLVFSIGMVVLGRLGWGLERALASDIARIDLDATLLHGMLGALLLAGALHVDLAALRRQRAAIVALATVSVLLSALAVGTLTWVSTRLLGIPLSFALCLAFGALISPTDPVAVLGILKQVRLPSSLEAKIAGESLFNDGVGVVLFLAILPWAEGDGSIAAVEILRLLLLEILGGVAYGLALGWLVFRMIRTSQQHQVALLLTLAAATGGYAAAERIGVSGPLAMVACGLLVGNSGRRLGLEEATRRELKAFWELLDEFLNALLFVMIGLEVLIVPWSPARVLTGAVAIPIVVIARWVAVGLPVTVLRRRLPISPHAVKILTWAGVRGGICIALALSLPASAERDLILVTTYVVVCFSILGQGLTLQPLLQRLYPAAGEAGADTGTEEAS